MNFWEQLNNANRVSYRNDLTFENFQNAIKQFFNKEMKAELIENVDFLIEEDKVVFTSKYHKDRGFCCGNGCKYCSYTKQIKGNTELDKNLDYEYITLDKGISDKQEYPF